MSLRMPHSLPLTTSTNTTVNARSASSVQGTREGVGVGSMASSSTAFSRSPATNNTNNTISINTVNNSNTKGIAATVRPFRHGAGWLGRSGCIIASLLVLTCLLLFAFFLPSAVSADRDLSSKNDALNANVATPPLSIEQHSFRERVTRRIQSTRKGRAVGTGRRGTKGEEVKEINSIQAQHAGAVGGDGDGNSAVAASSSSSSSPSSSSENDLIARERRFLRALWRAETMRIQKRETRGDAVGDHIMNADDKASSSISLASLILRDDDERQQLADAIYFDGVPQFLTANRMVAWEREMLLAEREEEEAKKRLITAASAVSADGGKVDDGHASGKLHYKNAFEHLLVGFSDWHASRLNDTAFDHPLIGRNANNDALFSDPSTQFIVRGGRGGNEATEEDEDGVEASIAIDAGWDYTTKVLNKMNAIDDHNDDDGGMKRSEFTGIRRVGIRTTSPFTKKIKGTQNDEPLFQTHVDSVVDYTDIRPHIFSKRAWANWYKEIGLSKPPARLKGPSRAQSYGGRRGWVDVVSPQPPASSSNFSSSSSSTKREFVSDQTKRRVITLDPSYDGVRSKKGPATVPTTTTTTTTTTDTVTSGDHRQPNHRYHQEVVKLAAAFSIYDANPRSESVIPAYSLVCVGAADCHYISQHIDVVYEFGVGYFVWYLNTDEERYYELPRLLQKAFPTRFIVMGTRTNNRLLSAAGAWNACVNFLFYRATAPIAWFVNANGDFFPNNDDFEDFLQFQNAKMRGTVSEFTLHQEGHVRRQGEEEEKMKAADDNVLQVVNGGEKKKKTVLDYPIPPLPHTVEDISNPPTPLSVVRRPSYNPYHTIIKFQHYSYFVYTYRAYMVLGSFDESVYPAYAEDVEMMLRAWSLGLGRFDDYRATSDQYRHVGSASMGDPKMGNMMCRWSRDNYLKQKWNINMFINGKSFWGTMNISSANVPSVAVTTATDGGGESKRQRSQRSPPTPPPSLREQSQQIYPTPWNSPFVPHRSSYAVDPRHQHCIRAGRGDRIPNNAPHRVACYWHGDNVLGLMINAEEAKQLISFNDDEYYRPMTAEEAMAERRKAEEEEEALMNRRDGNDNAQLSRRVASFFLSPLRYFFPSHEQEGVRTNANVLSSRFTAAQKRALLRIMGISVSEGALGGENGLTTIADNPEVRMRKFRRAFTTAASATTTRFQSLQSNNNSSMIAVHTAPAMNAPFEYFSSASITSLEQRRGSPLIGTPEKVGGGGGVLSFFKFSSPSASLSPPHPIDVLEMSPALVKAIAMAEKEENAKSNGKITEEESDEAKSSVVGIHGGVKALVLPIPITAQEGATIIRDVLELVPNLSHGSPIRYDPSLKTALLPVADFLKVQRWNIFNGRYREPPLGLVYNQKDKWTWM